MISLTQRRAMRGSSKTTKESTRQQQKLCPRQKDQGYTFGPNHQKSPPRPGSPGPKVRARVPQLAPVTTRVHPGPGRRGRANARDRVFARVLDRAGAGARRSPRAQRDQQGARQRANTLPSAWMRHGPAIGERATEQKTNTDPSNGRKCHREIQSRPHRTGFRQILARHRKRIARSD